MQLTGKRDANKDKVRSEILGSSMYNDVSHPIFSALLGL